MKDTMMTVVGNMVGRGQHFKYVGIQRKCSNEEIMFLRVVKERIKPEGGTTSI